MPKVSDEYKLNRRQQIIDAAYRCFVRNGFHETSMRDIYEETQLSPGAVYNYFRSKEEIIEGSFQFDYERSRELFKSARHSDDPLKALEELLNFLFTGLEDAARLQAPRINVQAWGQALINRRFQETMNQLFDVYLDDAAHIIGRAQERGEVDANLDSRAVARSILSLYFGLELQLALDPEVNVRNYMTVVKAILRGSFRQDSEKGQEA
jgi:AcrR family transcriptional regulator